MTSPIPSQLHPQDEALAQSLRDPESFWAHQAQQLYWHKKPESILRMGQKTLLSSRITHPTWNWFPGGEISTCYNCVGRHVAAGNGEHTAIYYDSPVTNTYEKYTYSRLLSEVETFAGVLREQGVEKGDVVMLYSKCIQGQNQAVSFSVSFSCSFCRRNDNSSHKTSNYQCP